MLSSFFRRLRSLFVWYDFQMTRFFACVSRDNNIDISLYTLTCARSNFNLKYVSSSRMPDEAKIKAYEVNILSTKAIHGWHLHHRDHFISNTTPQELSKPWDDGKLHFRVMIHTTPWVFWQDVKCSRCWEHHHAPQHVLHSKSHHKFLDISS